MQKASVLHIGAVGLGGAVVPALVQKGVGEVTVCDGDVVEVSNLNRQFFYRNDLYKPKALRLAHNSSRRGYLNSSVTGHYVDFDAGSADVLGADVDVAICGVDNNQTRAFASRYFRERMPVIFSAVNEAGTYGWVFIQHSGRACIGCVFPGIARAEREPRRCTPSPAVLDILQAVGALVVYAVDSVLMSRRCDWTFREINLVGDLPDLATVPKNTGCALCKKPLAPP